MKQKSFITRVLAPLWVLAVTVPSLAMAQVIRPDSGSVTTSLGNVRTLFSKLYGNVFSILTLVAGFLAVFLLIYQGIRYIQAGGDPAKAKAAQAGILSVVTGIIVVVATYFIIRVAMAIGGFVSKL